MQIDRRLASHFEWPLFSLAIGLGLIGILTIYSATRDVTGGGTSHLAIKQVYWLIIGMGAMIVSLSVDYHYIERFTYPIYGAVLALLFLVPIFGLAGGGSQRWIDLGYFTLQPSELAKLVVVLVLARSLQYDEPANGYLLRDLWLPCLLVLPILFLILLQPDLGTAVTYFLIALSVFLMGGLRLRSLFPFVLLGLALLPIGWQFLRPYQQRRIWTFINPELDPLGAGYHAIQSKIAIGSGRLLGKGFLNGSQNRLDFLPAQHTDFVFSVFAEEWGFVGSAILLGLYLTLIILSLRVVRRAKDRYGAILAFGMTAMIFWHIIINVAMVTGVLPVVGIPLPLFSYGGSALVTMMIAVGVLLNVSLRRFVF